MKDNTNHENHRESHLITRRENHLIELTEKQLDTVSLVDVYVRPDGTLHKAKGRPVGSDFSN
jgi:hypothetical protein